MESKEYYEEDDEIVIDLGVLKNDIFKGIRKFWWIGLLLVVFGAVALSVIRTVLYVPKYEAKVSFSIATSLSTADSEEEIYGFNFEKNTASLMADSFPYVLSSSVMQDVLKKDLGTEEINGEISAKAIENTNIFTVAVISDNPKDAYDIVGAIVKDYPEIVKYVIGDSQTNIIQEPVMPEEPYNEVSLIKTSVKGSLFGFVVWCVLLIIYALTRKTIRKEDNIRDQLNKHSYGTLPIVKKRDRKVDGNITLDIFDGRGGFRECMNSIATRVLNDLKKEEDKVIVITSTAPEEGKSTVAVNLAAALGQRGNSVLLIDADLYKQNMYMYINQSKEVLCGLVEYYEGKAAMEDIIYEAKELSCDVITGRLEPSISTAAILSSKKIGDLLKNLRKQYDYILIDTPPCEMLSDATEISRYADAAIFVIRHDYSKVRHIMDAMQNLYDSRINISGCILNGVSDGVGSYGKYGYGKYGYGKYGYGKYGGYGYGYGEKK